MRTKIIGMTLVALAGFLAGPAWSQEAGSTQSTDQSAKPEVVIDTTEGQIVVELDPEKSPETVKNFLKYVKEGYYDGTVFHRVIKGFMIQGGGMDKELKEKDTKPPIRNEAGNGLPNKKYSIAMARTNDPHSATSQFFINTANNAFLNRSPGNAGYAVFGRVVKGLDVVDKIENVRTGSRPNPKFPAMLMQDVPVKPVVIKSIKLREKTSKKPAE